MKRSLALAVAMIFASGAALAMHCPKDMKEIDAALAKHPKLSDAQMKEVTKLRADGEADHKAGKHAESVEKLGKAKAILGLKPAAAGK
jgi:hypothetical protein